ncbi:DUF5686 family protein [Mucilaginibacter sp.]|uniref:DUF5686 and carboxypeptidase-like regulatory domain-containing protein n=1 Tax=Mucilaginibacter sp. TaxID=1882438 RepID=UPI003D0F31F2
MPATLLLAQSTVVSGTVTDASNKQPLPFVTVSFTGTTIGIATDNDGKFSISSDKPVKQIKVSFLGYKDATFSIVPGAKQNINVRLFPSSNQLNEVVVKSGKKPKYRNKDNPAVELIRKVIENKEKNRPESYSYVEYKEYDKMQFSLSNVSPTLADKKFFRKYAFVINNRDSTTVPGKSLLPIFLNEKLSQYYYRKNPEKEKTTVLGDKTVNFGGSVDAEGLGAYFKHMYYKVDIYDNTIFLMTNNFLSPIANSAPTFYKFFITDTVMVNNTKLVELSFTPRNTADMLFVGKIYITLDGNYAVQKADLGINKNINLNFVRSMDVNQEFEQNPDGRWHLSKSTTLADFGITKNKKGGLFGIRTITYKNYAVNKPQPDTTYQNQQIAESDEVKHRSDQFWAQNRLDTLTTAESKVYKNVDSLRNMPSFRRTMDIATLLLAGYKNFNWFELGPANTFYSFNPVEGFKLRVGGRTTPELSKRYYFETYGAYGFKDEKFKYFLSATYSLNDKSIYKFPQSYIRASVQSDTHIPGANLQFVQEDNFLLSFKRGNNDKYLYDQNYRLDYVQEFENHFSYSIGLKNLKQTPAGSLYFLNTDANGLVHNISSLTSTELTVGLRYAPHEQFYQGKIYRTPIPSKYPVFSIDYDGGFKNIFGSQYNFQNLHGRIDKRVYLSYLGYADVTVEAGKIFGQVPYPLLNIFRANQTYAYDLYSYNLMNFLEFVSDHYESINIDQHFSGFFFNKIPLFKKLKWREVASFKAIYGGVSDNNNPALHPSLYQYPVTALGQPITYALGKTPYVEGSVGIENIFKFVRIDLVRRFTYLDHPDVSKFGIRTMVKFDF